MNKFPNQRYHYQKIGSQSGVTLILAMFILTAVVAVSFSLGSLVIREIRSSRYLSQSEPTILTAEAGAETGLFFRLRKISTVNKECGTAVDSESLAGIGSRFEVCSDFYDKPYYFTTQPGAVEVVMLINPTDETLAGGYDSIVIGIDPGVSASSLDIRAYNLDDPTETVTVSGIIGDEVILGGLYLTKSYAVFLVPTGGEATGFIWDRDYVRGIPSKNPKTFSTGKKGDLIRKLQVQWSR